MGFFDEFRQFAIKGNMIDMAVGVILGAAFGSIVSSLVTDIMMPPLGLLLGRVDFSNLYLNLSGGHYTSLADAQAAGAATINYGLFINNVISFFIVALATFLLVRWANRLQEIGIKKKQLEAPAAPITKTCPFCATDIPVKASRCPNCTSQLS